MSADLATASSARPAWLRPRARSCRCARSARSSPPVSAPAPSHCSEGRRRPLRNVAKPCNRPARHHHQSTTSTRRNRPRKPRHHPPRHHPPHHHPPRPSRPMTWLPRRRPNPTWLPPRRPRPHRPRPHRPRPHRPRPPGLIGGQLAWPHWPATRPKPPNGRRPANGPRHLRLRRTTRNHRRPGRNRTTSGPTSPPPRVHPPPPTPPPIWWRRGGAGVSSCHNPDRPVFQPDGAALRATLRRPTTRGPNQLQRWRHHFPAGDPGGDRTKPIRWPAERRPALKPATRLTATVKPGQDRWRY